MTLPLDLPRDRKVHKESVGETFSHTKTSRTSRRGNADQLAPRGGMKEEVGSTDRTGKGQQILLPVPLE